MDACFFSKGLCTKTCFDRYIRQFGRLHNFMLYEIIYMPGIYENLLLYINNDRQSLLIQNQ